MQIFLLWTLNTEHINYQANETLRLLYDIQKQGVLIYNYLFKITKNVNDHFTTVKSHNFKMTIILHKYL